MRTGGTPKGIAVAVLVPVLTACGPGTTDAGPREVGSGEPAVTPVVAPGPCPETFEQVPDPVLSSELADPVQVDYTLELGPAFLLMFTGPDATAVSLVVHDYGCHNSEPVSVAGLGVELAQLPWTEAPRALFRRLHTLLPAPQAGP